ncbi:hypothetical protein TNCV_2360371 [Trichonephila clavipes]|nr:hypothetical protein TNCV_2360371 [Trichonephila clavipes]
MATGSYLTSNCSRSQKEKEKWDDNKRVENREGSLGYPGFMKPVFTKDSKPLGKRKRSLGTATAGSDVVQSGRPIFVDFFQHLWPYIGNNTANVVFQMVKRLWLIRIDQ